jgi:hypothetical protein
MSIWEIAGNLGHVPTAQKLTFEKLTFEKFTTLTS